MAAPIQLTVDGRAVTVEDDGASLLEVLRDRLGVRSPKDGCSPQGQCGCCTVLVDGAPRVACVTPARRVDGRDIATIDGLPDARAWADAFAACGASQCGFCTPGIIVRLAALHASGKDDVDAVERALLAHLCRCTGWRTILEAYERRVADDAGGASAARTSVASDASDARARIEGHAPQRVGADVALGRGGFADDTAPPDALVAVRAADGEWVVAETLTEARRLAGKVQGRRTTVDARPPLALPAGNWARTLRTSWVEPAYLELDASWCEPGGEPATPLANGGAFGGKVASVVTSVARELADRHGRAVRVVLAREDAVRLGPKRPPVAAGVGADGIGVVRVARTPGISDAIARYAPELVVEEVDVVGPPTSTALRAAGWAECAVLLGHTDVVAPNGARAAAEVADDGTIAVRVRCGDPLDPVVLRSYCIGAAHAALGWITSEAIAVDDDGDVHDLTIRSFGVLRAVDTPRIDVEIEAAAGESINGSDAVFAAVAAAVWQAQGSPPDLPTGRSVRA